MRKSLLSLTAFLVTALASAQTFTDGLYNFKVTDRKNCEIAPGSTATGDITIPIKATDSGSGKTYNVTAVGLQAFTNNLAITSVVIPTGILTLKTRAFRGMTNVTSITIENGLTTLEDQVFQSCVNMSSIVLPNSVTKIGANSFYGCSKLASVTLSNQLTTIPNRTFFTNPKLTSITLPSSVTTIEDNAFCNLTGLVTIISKNPTPPTATALAFAGKTLVANIQLYVPQASISAYTKAEGWSSTKTPILPIEKN